MKKSILFFVSLLFLHQPILAQQESSVGLSYQKPGAPIRLVAPSTDDIEAGKTKRLRYQFLSPLNHGSVSISVDVDEGLDHSALSQYDFDASSEQLEIEFDVTAQENGKFYIRFMVDMGGQFRALGHKIQIGEAPAEVRSKTEKVTGGIRILPAKETIHKK